MLDENTIKTEIRERTAILTVNRPQALNALNADVLQGIILAFDKLALEPNLRAVVITGQGNKAFVAGADIVSMNDLGPRAIADYVELGQRCMRRIEAFHLPVIAAVNGYALGGGLELALACDLIVASKSAKLGQPEVNLGIIPGFGGTQRLLARVGSGGTKRLVLTGELIVAEEAKALGLVDYLSDEGAVLDEALKIADLIAKKAPLAVEKAKEILGACREQLLLSGLRLEVEGFLKLFASDDRAEGMQAFLQKRDPEFRRK